LFLSLPVAALPVITAMPTASAGFLPLRGPLGIGAPRSKINRVNERGMSSHKASLSQSSRVSYTVGDMHRPNDLRELRRRAEAMAQTGKYESAALICVFLQGTENRDLVNELFAMPTVMDGIDQVCRTARGA
jgi:hypothetical protein